jgi:hypothetical protein
VQSLEFKSQSHPKRERGGEREREREKERERERKRERERERERRIWYLPWDRPFSASETR